MAGKQAKVLSKHEIRQALDYISHMRYALRNKVLFLLSVKAGLRAGEIANLTWSMVTDASGSITNILHLPDQFAKGDSGRTIPLNSELARALTELYASFEVKPFSYTPIIHSERGTHFAPCNISHWFKKLFQTLRLEGCSSHSGRRTFITNAAKKIIEAGGSLRDVQQLAGHSSLQTTQAYIEGDSEAKRKVVELI